MLTYRDLYTSDVLDGLEAFVAAVEEQNTLPAAANAILRDWLTRQGFIPYQELPAGESDPDA